ncbi:nitrogenase, partial [bacterium]
TLYEQGKIIVYQKNQGKWTELRQREFMLDKDLGMKELRAGMEEAIEFLAGCDTFVARSIAGVPYFSLEKAGFSVWEFEGRPAEFLDYVLEQEEEARAEEAEQQGSNVIPLPVEIGDGRYKISLKEIQANNSGVTSKQVLQPFLRKGRFYELEVLCGHVPPWLEAELAAGNMAGEVEKISQDEFKVTIYKKTCDQC